MLPILLTFKHIAISLLDWLVILLKALVALSHCTELEVGRKL
uniref:Uncharacterized protein n=1 Tax=Arundo donax TaxID=35708 RepID=A0A0A9E1I4_ARUDO